MYLILSGGSARTIHVKNPVHRDIGHNKSTFDKNAKTSITDERTDLLTTEHSRDIHFMTL